MSDQTDDGHTPPSAIPQAGSVEEAHALIAALLEERLDPAGVERLESLVRHDPEIRRRYIGYMHQRCALAALARDVGGASLDDAADSETAGSMHETMILPAVRLPQARRDELEDESSHAPRIAPPRQRRFAISGNSRVLRLAAVAACLLMLIGLAILIRWRPARKLTATSARAAVHPASTPAAAQPVIIANSDLIHSEPAPPRQAPTTSEQSPLPVAILTRTLGARWDARFSQPVDGDPAPAKSEFLLAAGYAQFTFTRGAVATIEAPAHFILESTGAVFMLDGKLAATVPPPAVGFTVHTPQAVLTDLGTEFGVDVKGGGSADIEVFKGKVSAHSAQPMTGKTVELTAGKAADVDITGVSLEPQGALPQRFVRQLRTDGDTLDVVDLVAGGDGTTHRRGLTIDAATGVWGNFSPVAELTSDRQFHTVHGLPVADGCFVPNSRSQVDSAGHMVDLPATNSHSFNYIWAGGPVPWPSTKKPPYNAVLGGVDYAGPDHQLLLLHANNGLTLNLAEIRRLHPDCHLASLHCVFGNPAVVDPNGKRITVKADLFVIVDGEIRDSRRGFLNGAPFELDLPIRETDHFLTFATTGSVDGVGYDWVTLGDPQLRLKHE